MNKPVILCVDDERIILSSLKSQLVQTLGEEYRIEVAESGEEALEIIEELIEQKQELPLIIADQIMGGMYGDELLARAKKILPDTLSIMLTGQATAESVGEAVNKASLFRYISKPWNEDDLTLTIRSAICHYKDQRELKRHECHQEILNQVLQLALAPMPFEDRITQSLAVILSTECFRSLNKGSIYISDREHEDLVVVSQINRGIAPDNQGDFDTNDKQIRLIRTPASSDTAALTYYRAPIILSNKIFGFLYIYVDNRHQQNIQTTGFISSICHTLAGMLRLAQYNLALEKHNTVLEELVDQRTSQLNQALRKQEQLNDILLEANQKLEYYATTDELTGLMNRRSFFNRADQEAARAHRYGRNAMMIMLDVDFFKEVNDSHGHHIGDKLLAKVAQVIKANIREHDILGRVGGEEFAIVMPETDLKEAHEICERVRLAVSETNIEVEGTAVCVSISIGMSEIRRDELSIGNAMIRADQALYSAKHKGRNLISVN
ncbi:MAG: diguanylate cyclase [Hahellaceae bacterium]|nr:diguanylate cyclase [Hahellaceae bacterium]MCP5210692.1 diguanylate cyclase [Hahellaceae bacterium]